MLGSESESSSGSESETEEDSESDDKSSMESLPGTETCRFTLRLLLFIAIVD